MEIRELQWFVTLAEQQHVTAAADRLSISQPTLSRAIGRLERKLGVPLFDREQNKLRLNKFGELFRAHALRAIAEIETAERRLAALGDPAQGTIALGFLHSYGTWLVPKLLSGYRSISPGSTFELRGAAADIVVHDVRNGRLDLGLTSPQPIDDDLQWAWLMDEQLGLLVPEHHRLAREPEISMGQLVDEYFVALLPVYGLRQVADRLCDSAGFVPRIVLEATELSTLRALVAAGLGIAVVPAPQAGQPPTPDVINIPLTDHAAYRPIGVITVKGGSRAPGVQRFHEYIKTTAHAPGA